MVYEMSWARAKTQYRSTNQQQHEAGADVDACSVVVSAADDMALFISLLAYKYRIYNELNYIGT